jgi:protein-tyrosine phosphatase
MKIDRRSILFICLGNICRSPAAEGIMKKMAADRGLSDRLYIDSAGIGSWHVGQLPDARMRRHGEMHGYSFDSRARQFKTEDFDQFDNIAVMDHENYGDVAAKARNRGDRERIICMADYLRHHPYNKTVPDPYYGGDRDFELVIELLEDACEGLLDKLEKEVGHN